MSKDHASVKDYIRAAEEKGVDEVGFATHFIVSGPFINGASRLKRYLSTLGRLRQHRTPPVSS
ncbi:MAG: hypothetical protein QG670_1281 [Thermoproteota archaeon]|nr:hypothetical protein [Thermoproteota archaeon]